MANLPPTTFRYPFALEKQPPDVVQAHQMAFNAIFDLQNAIKALKSQINTHTTAISAAAASTASTIVVNSSNFPGLGAIRDETGSTAYTNLQADNGILLILNDASAVAVTLDSSMVTPYFLFSTNGGTGTVTYTPTSGLINGAASWVLPEGGLFLIAFDGVNWKTSDVLVLAQTFNAVAHEWLNSYSATTGIFTATQPAFTDISGNLATSQLPTAGLTTTITTAKLTSGGANGSMTFTNGLLTASTPAT